MSIRISRRPAGRCLLVVLLCTWAFAPARSGELSSSRAAYGHDDDYVYALPYEEDASFVVLQAYGSRLSHRGPEYYTIDFRMREGTPVLSAREGVVVEAVAGERGACWTNGCESHANRVIVRHSDGSLARYFHLAAGRVAVVSGQRVERGQLLGLSGNTGLSTTPHLHFGVYVPIPGDPDQSIPVRFLTTTGPLELRQGRRYSRPAAASPAPRRDPG